MKNNLKPWWVPERGDIDAIIVQLGFNLAQMVIPVLLLLPLGISIEFGVAHFLPGYALGFLLVRSVSPQLPFECEMFKNAAMLPRTSTATMSPRSSRTRSSSLFPFTYGRTT